MCYDRGASEGSPLRFPCCMSLNHPAAIAFREGWHQSAPNGLDRKIASLLYKSAFYEKLCMAMSFTTVYPCSYPVRRNIRLVSAPLSSISVLDKSAPLRTSCGTLQRYLRYFRIRGSKLRSSDACTSAQIGIAHHLGG